MKPCKICIFTACCLFLLLGAMLIYSVLADSPSAQAATDFQFDFDSKDLPAGWNITGDAGIDTSKNRTSASGGALKLGAGSVVSFDLCKSDSVGRIEFWVYEDGTVPTDLKAYRDGPSWGTKALDGMVQNAGIIYASYLSGENSYALGMSADGKGLYQEVIYLGVKREKGWHKWTFLYDNEKGLVLSCDDNQIAAVNRDNIKALGFTSLQFQGDTGTDNRQIVWIDDVSASVTGVLKPSGDMESRVMQPITMPEKGYYAKWPKNMLANERMFPIGVWLQDPARAAEYKAIGINFYIGLWAGPTEEQLTALKNVGMPVMCSQNAVGLKHINDPNILGWTQEDEPDNAQSDGKGGWGPPVLPSKTVEIYNNIKSADPSRPVFLNLGQGVAWDNWYGRGVRTNKPEDYPEYAKGGDIISYDIYPVVTPDGDVRGKLWKVPYGVDRLIKWTEGKKPIWNCIECTRISNPNAKPTPAQVKAEVWMSIIHGSQGIIYFVHQFQDAGGFIEAGLLADPEMSKAVGAINKQVSELAPVIKSQNIAKGVSVTSENIVVPVDVAVKKYKGAVYLFAVAMRNGATKAAFSAEELKGKKSVEVIGENRKIDIKNGKFADDFQDFAVHLYKVL